MTVGGQLSLLAPSPMLRDARIALPDARRPRPYQAKMVAQALADFRDFRSTLGVMATGTGKTFTAAQVIAHWLSATRGSVLWLNERDNLVTQVRGELAAMLGCEVAIEAAERKAPDNVRVVVGSVQSMCQPNRLASFDPARFALIVCDEAHHGVAETYRRIFAHFMGAKILGLTATPNRLDGLAMQLVFEKQCADYRMGQAIADGYLVGLRVKPGRQKVDLSKLKRAAGGDFTDEAIAGVLTPDVLKGMVEDISELHEGRRGASYWPRVEIAHVAAKVHNLIVPGSARAVDGSMDRDEKNAIIAGHRRGDFLHLANCGVIVEGHDDAGIGYIFQGRKSASVGRCIQEWGRLSRPLCLVDNYATAAERRALIAASTKPDGLILDAVYNYGRHADAIAHPIDALAGTLDDEKTKKRAREILEENGGGDVEGALAEARKLSEREREQEAHRVARVEARRHEWGKAIDPFAALGISPQSDVVSTLAPPPSLKMRRYLWNKLGTVPPSLTDADAKRLSKTIRAREAAGLADMKTVQWLSRYGIPAQRMYQETANRAREAIRQKRDWSVVEAIVGGSSAASQK